MIFPVITNYKANFLKLLRDAMIEPQERVVALITGNGWLSSRMTVLTTSEEAVRLYNDASSFPQTETRSEVLKDSNIKIGCPIFSPGVHATVFLSAFEGVPEIPRVLKVPHDQAQAATECRLYEELGQDANRYALVPVRPLKRKVRTHMNESGPVKSFNWGILMPTYACTLSEVVSFGPISIELAQHVFTRINQALEFLQSKGWIHGDVKPSNIFIAHDGVAWLGDYGSSCTVAECAQFTGGTPMFQIHEIDVSHPLFDKAGLCLSLIAGLVLARPGYSLNQSGNKLADVQLKIEAVRQRSSILGDQLASLLVDTSSVSK